MTFNIIIIPKKLRDFVFLNNYNTFSRNCQARSCFKLYYCKNCGRNFEKPQKEYEKHIFTDTPFELFYTCPFCKSRNFREHITTHCRCCGAKLPAGKTEYCSEACKSRGKKLWEREFKRRERNVSSPISIITRECNEYNRQHNTRYSYGQYVALIKPRLKEKSKCESKRKNT